MTRNTRRHKTIAYDPVGNRTVKEHGGGEAVWVNSKHAGTMTDTVTCSIYPNPYININGNRWTKHYYIGGERIASKTGFISGGFGGLSTTENKVAGHDSGMTIRYDNMRDAEEDSIDSMYARLGVPYRAHQTNTRGDGWYLYLPSTRDGDDAADGSGGDLRGNHPLTLGEGRVYFYHRDHLGSTMSVTDSIGNTVQQVEYTPWGEVFVERRFGTSGFAHPYLFNGKELDEETGLYYYGARYYDPKMSVWYSTDPMEMDYPWVSTYGYCADNPIVYIDSKGEKIVSPKGNNAVIIKNNRFVFTKYATPSIKRTVNSLLLTKEGKKMLTQAVKSDILVKITISKKVKISKVSNSDGKGYTYGETVQGNLNPNDNYGRYKTKDGKYGIRMAEATIYEGTLIEDAKTSNAKHSGLTLEQAIGAVAGHELVHATDKDEIHEDVSYEMNNKGNSRDNKEIKPNKIEKIIIEQSKQINK